MEPNIEASIGSSIDIVGKSVFFITTLIWYTIMLDWNETRSSLVKINDPLFIVEPIDVSNPVMGIMYTSMAWFIWNHDMWLSEEFCWIYILFVCTRIMFMAFQPFLGDPKMYPLRDVLVERLMGAAKPLQNDLSFSGHISHLVLMGFMCSDHKVFFWTAAFVTVPLLIVSRVHYTCDCFIAPIVVYFCVHNGIVLQQLWDEYISTNPIAVASICLPFWVSSYLLKLRE